MKNYYLVVLYVLILTFSRYGLTNTDDVVSGKDFFKAGAETEGKVVKLANGFCHGKDSPQRESLSIKIEEPLANKTYDSYIACLADGGQISEAIKSKLISDGKEGSPEELGAAQENGEREVSDRKDFAGINWGVGLAFTRMSSDIIESVSIVSDADKSVVSVDSQRKNRALVMLESHYFWTNACLFGFRTRFTCWDEDTGIGPFVSIGVSGEDGVDPLETYGVGLMWGKRLEDSGRSWNVGLGWFQDTKVKVLKSGIANGFVTTESDPTRLTETRDMKGVMLLFSASW